MLTHVNDYKTVFIVNELLGYLFRHLGCNGNTTRAVMTVAPPCVALIFKTSTITASQRNVINITVTLITVTSSIVYVSCHGR